MRLERIQIPQKRAVVGHLMALVALESISVKKVCILGVQLWDFTGVKPHSHCADVATVHPDAGQPVYRDAPGHISYKINCVLSLLTLPRYSPGSRESKTPVDPRFTTEHLRCSTVEPRFVPVYPGVTQVVYGDVPVTAGCATVTCR